MIVCFNQLLNAVSQNFGVDMWQQLCKTFVKCFETSIPNEIMDQVQ